MKFWQCIVIALLLHMAIMAIPMKMATDIRMGDVCWLITDRVVSPVAPEVASLKMPKPERPETTRLRPVKPLPYIQPVQEKIPEILRETEPVHMEPARQEIAPPRPPVEVSVVSGSGTPQAPRGAKPVEMSFGSSEGPKFIRQVRPLYPRKAEQLRKSGTVILMLTIDEKGKLVDLQIVEGAGYGFDEESIRAVRQSTFRSARRNGKPISCRALLPVRFELR